MIIAFLQAHQLNYMLGLSCICAITAFFTLLTKTLSKKRKLSLFLSELYATILLTADRYAYIYRGDPSVRGYWMVRICNFLVFLMTLAIIHAVNLYLSDILRNSKGRVSFPVRLRAAEFILLAGVVLLVISQFTGLYYTFDEENRYQRGPGFVICYLIPLLVLVIQFSMIVKYRGSLSRSITISFIVFTVIPVVASLVQIFVYGLSLTNISLSGVVILLYVFALIDINSTAEMAQKREIEYLKDEQDKMQHLFEQTAGAFVNALDAKDLYTQGHSMRVAGYAKMIAEGSGKTPEEIEKVYYAAMLHDVGRLGIPDSILKKNDELTEEEMEIVRQQPVIGNQILSGITDFPYISLGAHFHRERYDGKGYPKGLKGEKIPEIARIIAVADAYDTMTSQTAYRDPLPQPMVREELVKGSGTQFDPEFTSVMLQLIGADSEYKMRSAQERGLEQELSCEAYRTTISSGVSITQNIIRIHMRSRAREGFPAETSVPSVIIYDAFDKRVHETEKSIKATRYMEYAELWFDGHSICTSARNLKTESKVSEEAAANPAYYLIEMARYKDHLRIRMQGSGKRTETVIALPDSSRSAYLALTGEQCEIREIETEMTQQAVGEDEIPRIAEEVSYINRMESDLPNMQIEGYRALTTKGIPVRDGLKIQFHTMSLPAANLVWHCAYIVLYYSDDEMVEGPNYREFALIRLDGESEGRDVLSKNKATVEKSPECEDWEAWKELNQEGMECEVTFSRSGSRITTLITNRGICISNTTTISDRPPEIYVTLTGDQCALTDIRIY